ncbi:MAG: glycosyltransferase family 2 protein [Bdellovibrionales bacterium]|nr:glycosyltransferase family 2 protein [Bdellovibrionales bacterium]
MKIGILVPAYNVSPVLGKVIRGIAESPHFATVAEVLIIDNQSTDSTHAVALAFSGEASPIGSKITVLRHHQNYGYGSSIKTGFQYFLDRPEVTHILVIHGDHQADPEAVLETYVQAGQVTGVEAVVGSRFMAGADSSHYSLVRKLGNYFFNFLTWILTGQKMSDAGAAVALLSVARVRQIPFLRFSNSMQFHPQFNIFLYRNCGETLLEVPVGWKDSEVPSTVRVFSYGLELLRLLFRYRVRVGLGTKDEEIFEPLPKVSNKSYDLFRGGKFIASKALS